MCPLWRTAWRRWLRRDEGKRGYGEGENREKRDFARMRNKHADGATVDRAAEGPHEIIERCLQRSSDAHLRHDDGCQYRPQRQGKLQELRKRKRH